MTATWPLGESERAVTRRVTTPGAGTAARDEWLLYASMGLLIISTVQGLGTLGTAVKVLWLASVAVLTLVNVGAAVGVYIASLALYSVIHLDGFGRLDHFALIILMAGLTWQILAARGARWRWDGSTLLIATFLVYGVVQTAAMGLLSRSVFVIYVWMPGLPMVMFLLLTQLGLTATEFRALLRSLLVLGTYMAVISILEAVGWYGAIVPVWIVDPSPYSITGGLGSSTPTSNYPGRAGGLLMQPAWNGLALSLIFCVAMLAMRLSDRRPRWPEAAVSVLCVVGVFATYTRAAWMGCLLGTLVLLTRPSVSRAKTRLKRLGVALGMAACVAVLLVLPDTAARQRIDESGTVLYRLNLWKAALSMTAAHPVFGTGFNSFAGNVSDYRDEMTVGGHMNIDNDAAHNTLLSMLVELGVVGLVLYVGALMVIFRRAWRAAQHEWGREGAAWVVVFAGVYFLQAQFAVAHEPTTNVIFFGVMGAVAGLLPPGPARGWRRSAAGLQPATATVGSGQ